MLDRPETEYRQSRRGDRYPMKIYVSGPIKGHDDFVEKFKAACEEVAQWAKPVNPVEVGNCDLDECRWPGEMLETGHTWECYIRYDLAQLVLCDGIYLMEGWSTSKGASLELKVAMLLGMQLYFQSDKEDDFSEVIEYQDKQMKQAIEVSASYAPHMGRKHRA